MYYGFVEGGSRQQTVVKMPSSIERCVRRQNINFLHNRNQFCPEYFRFMRRLLATNVVHVQPLQGEEKLVRCHALATWGGSVCGRLEYITIAEELQAPECLYDYINLLLL